MVEALMGGAKREGIPAKVKTAIAFLIEQRNDLQAAAPHAGISMRELRRAMGQPQVRRYSLEQRQIELERFCLGSPMALARVRDNSENGIAVVNAVRAGEILRQGALQEEGAAQRRMPGLQIVLVQGDGTKQVVAGPPPMPMTDVTPKPAAPEAVPAMPAADIEAE
jgi:hypothetical protein